MSPLMLVWSGLRHKHPTQHLTPYTAFSLTAALLTLSVFPAPALAFEVELPYAPSQKLTLPVQLEGHLPEYSFRESGVAIAVAPVITTPGIREQRRYVAAVPTAIPQPAAGPMVLEGEASYYSRAGCLGCSPALRMANGQPLNDNALTMAIGADKKHLVGRKATVTNLVTGQAVQVTITDTGGFYQAKYGHRVADLTIATKQAIGMHGGVGQVRVEVH
jgi:rare lipoprotein A (peptidoglycan hydrolase)